jgi:hypothetical protein
MRKYLFQAYKFCQTANNCCYYSLRAGVGIAKSCRLHDNVRFPTGARSFLYSTATRLTLLLTQNSSQRVSGIQQPEREAGNLLPSNAEVKNVGAVPPLPHTSS